MWRLWERRCKAPRVLHSTQKANNIKQKFEVQLAPLVKELKSDDTAELFFVNGPVEAFPPEGFESFFGLGPYYRFIKPAETESGSHDVLERIRHFPKGLTAEDQMRELMGGGLPLPDMTIHSNDSAQEALEYLYEIMETEGPFDGIIGYSEGATMAATLILHEQRRFEKIGRASCRERVFSQV